MYYLIFIEWLVLVLKTHFHKSPPKVVTYRELGKFENGKFMDSLKLNLNNQVLIALKIRKFFYFIFFNYVGMNLSIKCIRGNNKPFIIKALYKSNIEKTRLRNTFLKNPAAANKLAYTKK